MIPRFAVARLVGATLIALAVAPWASATPATAGDRGGGAPDGHTVTICHRTNSDANPYVVITVDTDATGGGKDQGAGDHAAEHQGPVWSPGLKSQHVEWGDIIPPYTDDHGLSFPGHNWSAQGQAIYAQGCRAVASTSSAPVSTSTSAAPSTTRPTKTHTTSPTKTHTTRPTKTHTPKPSLTTTTASSAPVTFSSSGTATTTTVPVTTSVITSSVPAATTSSVPATTTQPVAATSTSIVPTSSSVAVSSSTEVAVLPTKVGTTTVAAAPLAPTGARLPRWALLTFSAALLLIGGTLVLGPGRSAAARARRH